jgi:hypothetical protein
VLLRRGGDGLPLDPGLPAPRMLRMAWAPKLMRRLKGVVGAVRIASSSSTAFSSMASELLVDRLARRIKGVADWGEVPDRPRVVTDSLRRWSLMAAVVMGPGNGAAPCPCDTELLRKSWLKAVAETDPRRCERAMSSLGFVLSEDMVMAKGLGRARV